MSKVFHRRHLRWWLIGLAGAIGLGIFMWAVGGRWNLPADKPDAHAASPAEAVQEFLAAVDRHDEELARAYTTERYASQVDDWIGRAGYVRFVAAGEARAVAGTTTGDGVPGGGMAVVVPVTYGQATGFLDGEDPLGLNLALLVWPQPLKRDFTVVLGSDGGWRVDAATEAANDTSIRPKDVP